MNSFILYLGSAQLIVLDHQAELPCVLQGSGGLGSWGGVSTWRLPSGTHGYSDSLFLSCSIISPSISKYFQLFFQNMYMTPSHSPTAASLVEALARLQSLFPVWAASILAQLQPVLHTAPRHSLKSKSDRLTPWPENLQRLPVSIRVKFKWLSLALPVCINLIFLSSSWITILYFTRLQPGWLSFCFSFVIQLGPHQGLCACSSL